MDYKIKINEALDQIENFTGKGSTGELREQLSKESNPGKLFLKLQALRETLAEMDPESKTDLSFTIQHGGGVTKSYPNLDVFLQANP